VEPEYFIKIIDGLEYVFAKDDNYGKYRFVPNFNGSVGYDKYLEYVAEKKPVGTIEN
jgi:hypothetical protein